MTELLYQDSLVEVWHGDSLEPDTVATVMQGRTADLLHVDAPYSARTHTGHGHAGISDGVERSAIAYPHWTPSDVGAFCGTWLDSVSGWVSSVTDSDLSPVWSELFRANQLYTFAPLPWVETGSRVRMGGDGPSSWTCWLVVARPKTKPWSTWGTLPGAYIQPGERRPHRITGGKGIQNTIAFLGDYSKRGQLVLDPCLGGGTTAIAAKMTGRRCIGVEKDRGRAELCVRLLQGKREQRDMFDV
jgi:hypothetical protein